MRILKAIHWLDEHLEEVLMVGLLAAIICVILFQVIMCCFFRSAMACPEERNLCCFI